tara:strand:+ start:273 stop:563 length:291 start_codon:yes stop_codon:yes gene_type:complete
MASGVFGGLPDAVIQFQTTVGTSAAALASSAPADSLTFLADAANGATVFIGNSSSVTTSNGYPLAAGSAITLKISNSNLVYAISGSSNQKLHTIGS